MQQNELELVLELDGDFFGRKTKCMGAGISGGGHHGPTRKGGARPGPSWPGSCPPTVFSVPKILKYSIKNHTKFAGHLDHFYFWYIFLLHGQFRKQTKYTIFALFQLNNRK